MRNSGRVSMRLRLPQRVSMRFGGLSCRRIRAKLEPGDAKAKRSWLRALAKKPEPPPVKRPSVAWEPGTAGTPEPEPSSASVKEPEVTRSLEWKQSGARCLGRLAFRALDV